MILFYQSLRASNLGTGNVAELKTETDEVCRIVIPSANLTRADWGVGGVMENILFVVDLPLKRSGSDEKVYPFERKLRAQLSGMGVPEGVLPKLGRFDFEATRGMEFVYSRSGSHALDMGAGSGIGTGAQATLNTKALGVDGFFQKRGKESREGKSKDTTGNVDRAEHARAGVDDPARTGLLSLQDAVVSLGLDVPVTELDDLPQVDFITSSLGNLTSQFVRQLYLAICGQLDPAKTIVAARRLNPKAADTDAMLDKIIAQNLKIYFPTSETVQRSKGGPSAGGTICFQSKWWDSNELIRKCLHDCVGVRKDGILMHSKVCDLFFFLFLFPVPKIVQGHIPCTCDFHPAILQCTKRRCSNISAIIGGTPVPQRSIVLYHHLDTNDIPNACSMRVKSGLSGWKVIISPLQYSHKPELQSKTRVPRIVGDKD
jgi:hypothetical protein